MLGNYSMATATGLIVATGAANATVWACRWTDSAKRAVINALRLNAVVTGTITTAVPYDLAAYFVKNFTVIPASGVTAATLTGRNGARKTSFDAPLMGGIYALDTAAAGMSTAISIRSASYRWTLSTAGGAGVYYCELVGGGNPTLATPAAVRENDVDMTLASAVNAISAGQYWYGDGDTLGFSTVYVKLSDGTDPDGKAAGYVTHWVGAVFTPDAQPLARISGATGTVIGTQFFGAGMPASLLGGYPAGQELELGQNEGIIIRAPLAGPATGTFRVGVNLDWREVA